MSNLSDRIDSFINKARTPEDILRVGSATPEQKEKLGKIDAVRAKYKRPWRTNIHPNSYQTAEERKEKYHLARELGANRNQAVGLRDNHYGIMALHLAKQIDDFIQKQEMSERLKQLLEQTRRDWEKLKTANPEERAKILGKKKLKPYVKYGGKLIPREEAERRRNRVYDKYDPVTGNRTHEKIIKPVLKQAIEDFRKALKFESEKEFEDWQTKLPKEEQIKEPEKIERPKADVETPSYPSPKRKKGADVISEVGRQLSPKGPGYHSPEDITEDIRESQRLARKITGQNGD